MNTETMRNRRTPARPAASTTLAAPSPSMALVASWPPLPPAPALNTTASAPWKAAASSSTGAATRSRSMGSTPAAFRSATCSWLRTMPTASSPRSASSLPSLSPTLPCPPTMTTRICSSDPRPTTTTVPPPGTSVVIVLLQAALNGRSTTTDHPAVPESPEALVRDAVACVAAGARAIHVHPRDPSGRETLEPAVVDEVVRRVRAACGVPVGVTTAAWVEPSASWRVSLVKGWRAPDYASVNVSEEGWLDVARALLDGGVGVEAGVWSVQDAHALAASGLAGELTRVLVEPPEVPREEAVALVDAIH